MTTPESGRMELLPCPFCKQEALMLDQMEVDIEVGVMKGPELWHCENCQSYWTGPYLFTRTPTPDRVAAFQEGLGDGSDKSNDVAWLRAGFLSRGAEIEKLEAQLKAAIEALKKIAEKQRGDIGWLSVAELGAIASEALRSQPTPSDEGKEKP